MSEFSRGTFQNKIYKKYLFEKIKNLDDVLLSKKNKNFNRDNYIQLKMICFGYIHLYKLVIPEY